MRKLFLYFKSYICSIYAYYILISCIILGGLLFIKLNHIDRDFSNVEIAQRRDFLALQNSSAHDLDFLASLSIFANGVIFGSSTAVESVMQEYLQQERTKFIDGIIVIVDSKIFASYCTASLCSPLIKQESLDFSSGLISGLPFAESSINQGEPIRFARTKEHIIFSREIKENTNGDKRITCLLFVNTQRAMTERSQNNVLGSKSFPLQFEIESRTRKDVGGYHRLSLQLANRKELAYRRVLVDIWELVFSFVILAGAMSAVFGFLSNYLIKPFWQVSKALEGMAKGIEMDSAAFRFTGPLRNLGLYLQATTKKLEFYQEQQRQLATTTAIARMVQMLAHDVRRPFSMLKMLLEGISKTKTPEQMKLFASKGIPETIRAMNSVNGLIQDVMEIGSNSEVFASPTKPETLLEAALGEVFQSLPTANVSISYALKHVSHVNVESGKVLRVFANILGNAVQAMDLEGIVRIETSNIEENGQAYVLFVFGNNGPPIAAEHLPKLFEAFFTSGKKGGTGLGLAIAHKIVTAHGGKIWCESSPSIGVEFHLTLPAIEPELIPDVSALAKNSQEICLRFKAFADATPDDDAEVRLEISLKNLLPDLGRRLSVLIVDDENIYRNSLTESLTRNQDLASLLEIVSAEHSDGALALSSPDLAIVDVDLGPTSLSGFELVQEMRKRGQEGFVCIHSNRISASDSKTAIAQGADAFLPKPMSRAHLLKLLCQALERLGLVDPTLSSSKAAGSVPTTVNKSTEATSRDENSMVSVFVDDVATIRMSWEMDWPMGKLVTFASPEKFWSHVDANSGFLDSLACIVTDLNFGDLSAIDGHEFARQLKQRVHLPIFVASNSNVKVEDFGGTVDGVLERTPPDRVTLARFLFGKN